MWYFVEEYGDGRGRTDCGGGVERGRHGEPVGYIVSEVGAGEGEVWCQDWGLKSGKREQGPYIRLRYPASFTLALSSFSSVFWTFATAFPSAFFLDLAFAAGESIPLATVAGFSSSVAFE